MARDITIPSLGVAMEDALLVAWLKQPGDAVEPDEPVAEIETDKSTVELVAPVAGRLGPHLYAEGATVPVGVVIAAVYALDGDAPLAGAATEEPGVGEIAARPVTTDRAVTTAAAAPARVRDEPDGAGRRPHRTSPRSRRLAATERRAAPATFAAPAAPARSGRFREIIATRVSESWRTIPHFSVMRDIDVEALRDALSRLKAAGHSVTVTDMLLRAHALALADGADSSAPSDLGLAVASEHGVVIPVLRDVLRRSLDELATAREAAVSRGRSGRLTPDDLQLPASTLSNLGPFAIDSFTGIIAHGQTSLITVGRIRRAPHVLAEEVVARDMLTATVNADHRVLDGADAARMLAAFASQLESPNRLVQEGPIVV
jgi:pyruvate dehydrogenase E2 component (dihydrolipoamide acetyltransferase)